MNIKKALSAEFWDDVMDSEFNKPTFESKLKEFIYASMLILATILFAAILNDNSLSKIAFYFLLTTSAIAGCVVFLTVGNYLVHFLHKNPTYLLWHTPYFLFFALGFYSEINRESLFTAYVDSESLQVSSIELNSDGDPVVSIGDSMYKATKAGLVKGDTVLVNKYYFDAKKESHSHTKVCNGVECFKVSD